MIHYHGTPIWPTEAACALLATRHACVSFAGADQMPLVAEVCQSFMLDNGAYSVWKQGGDIDFEGYVEFVKTWMRHPGFDFAIIPDVIDGNENDNLRMIASWQQAGLLRVGVPVWHLHESLEHLESLVNAYPRIAFGSSGAFSEPGSEAWWHRIGEAMSVVCDSNGYPRCKLHGLRMLSPTIFSHVPLSSADSTNVARSIPIDSAWKGAYQPVTRAQRALVLANRIENHVAAVRWNRPEYGTQQNLELIG